MLFQHFYTEGGLDYMKVIGVIAEFNPFHNGHEYLLQTAKKNLEADAIVIVMSPNFVQRGDLAVCNKWTRAEMALSCGADLVIELPACFALQSAEGFTQNAVYLLNALGIINFLAFGTEQESLQTLQNLADILVNQDSEIHKEVRTRLKCGINFASAREKVIKNFLGKDIALNSPNNILAVEYLKALKQQKSCIQPYAISRKYAGHHDTVPDNSFASASYLRQEIKKEQLTILKKYMPYPAFQLLINKINHGEAPVFKDTLSTAIVANLRKTPISDLKKIIDVTEGLENRIKRACEQYADINAILEAVKTKRYTHSRLERILLNSFLGLPHSWKQMRPAYLRILGFNDIGSKLLKQAKNAAFLPIISKFADFHPKVGSPAQKQRDFEICADDIYALCYPEVSKQVCGWDFFTSPVKR